MSLTNINYSKTFRAKYFELRLSEGAVVRLYKYQNSPVQREKIFDIVQKKSRRYSDEVVTAESWLEDCNTITDEVIKYTNLLESDEDTIENVDKKC